jgi:hypothetical protein
MDLINKVKLLVTSNLPSRKVPVEIFLHPLDVDRARAAAQLLGMEFHEFCALAIHKEARDLRSRL